MTVRIRIIGAQRRYMYGVAQQPREKLAEGHEEYYVQR
jgi:hypothetical protein